MTDISAQSGAGGGGSIQKPVPAWVGVALVCVCVLAGAAFIYWVVRDPLTGGADFVPDNNGPVAGRGRAVAVARQVNPDTIRKVSDSPQGETYVAQSAGSIMEIDTKSGKTTYRFRYQRKDLLDAAQKEAMMMRFRLVQDDTVAQLVGLTDEQKTKLQKVAPNVAMELAQGDRDKLVGQWEAYKAADDKGKPAAEKTLLASLKEVGDKSLDPTRKKAAERIAQINQILSAEQVEKYKNMGNAQP